VHVRQPDPQTVLPLARSSRADYDADIVRRMLYVISLIAIAVAPVVGAARQGVSFLDRDSLEGQLASRFADVYSAFGPIYTLYGEYAEYLFDGSPMTIPEDLKTACEDFAIHLAVVHLTLVTQTESEGLSTSAVMIRLRGEAAAFCGTYQTTLATIASSPEVDLDDVDAASDAGLFAEIYALNELLGRAFADTFDAIDEDEARWCFAVAFATRSLVNRASADRLDESLAEILYGGPNRSSPPFPLPREIADAMADLVSLCGRDLVSGESDRARVLAAKIHAYFVPSAAPEAKLEEE